MSNAQNLHRIMGAVFQHAKPGLCDRCALRQPYGEWEGYCTAKGKILSYTSKPAKRPRCDAFQPEGEEAARG
jgi:hypothetical protein